MKKRLIALFLAVFMVVSLSACSTSSSTSSTSSPAKTAVAQSSAPSTSSESDSYVIAMSTALTGPIAEAGTQYKDAVQLAMDEINKAGGVNGKQLKLVAFDDKCDVTESTLVANRIAEKAKDYLMVFSPLFSSNALATMDIYTKAGLPVFVGTPNSDDIKGDNFVRMCLPAKIQGPQMAACAFNNRKITDCAIVYAMNDYSLGMIKVIEVIAKDKGVKISVKESYTAGTDKDFSSILTKCRSSGVGGIIVIGDYNEGSMIIQQAGKMGGFEKISFVSNASLFGDTFLERVSGSGLEGNIYLAAGYNPYATSKAFTAFNEKFLKLFGASTTEPAVYGYDMVQIVTKALEAGATKQDLIKTIKGLKFTNLVSVDGEITFYEDGSHSTGNCAVIGVKNGAFMDTKEIVDFTGIKY